jgi:hypothetical protein
MRHLTFDNKSRRRPGIERVRYLELKGFRIHQGTDRAQLSSMGQQTQEALGKQKITALATAAITPGLRSSSANWLE